jgi:hypothetical protein
MILREKIEDKATLYIANEMKAQEQQANNEALVELYARNSVDEKKIAALDLVIKQLTAIKAIIANDGTKYRVHCYPTASATFGEVDARVMGILLAAGSMFTEERMAEYSAITGIPCLMAKKIVEDIGSPAYINKDNVLVEEVKGPLANLEVNMMAVGMGLTQVTQLPITPEITTSKIDTYFTKAKNKAEERDKENQLSEDLDNDPFTMQD